MEILSTTHLNYTGPPKLIFFVISNSFANYLVKNKLKSSTEHHRSHQSFATIGMVLETTYISKFQNYTYGLSRRLYLHPLTAKKLHLPMPFDKVTSKTHINNLFKVKHQLKTINDSKVHLFAHTSLKKTNIKGIIHKHRHSNLASTGN